MKCADAKQLMSPYLDSEVQRGLVSALQDHLQSCVDCSCHHRAIQRTRMIVSAIGRKPVPPDLMLKLRIGISREKANVRQSRWDRLRVRWENAFSALMVPATGGLVTAVSGVMPRSSRRQKVW